MPLRIPRDTPLSTATSKNLFFRAGGFVDRRKRRWTGATAEIGPRGFARIDDRHRPQCVLEAEKRDASESAGDATEAVLMRHKENSLLACNGYAHASPAQRTDVAGSVARYEAGNERPAHGTCHGLPLPASRRVTWTPRYGFRGTTKGYFCQRMFLAPTRRLSELPDAEIKT